MTDTAAPSPLLGESLGSLTIRRIRCAVAIVLCAWLFGTVGWAVAAPPAEVNGVSLLAWSKPLGLVAAVVLLALWGIAMVLAMIVTYPEAPHMGLYCSAAGLMALAVRGGSIETLLKNVPRAPSLLAAECLIWAGMIAVVEVVRSLLFRSYFRNDQWITRTGLDTQAMHDFVKHQPSQEQKIPMDRMTLKWAVGAQPHTLHWLTRLNLPQPVLDTLAFLITGVVATVLLLIMLPTPLKAQALFGCMASFFLAGLVANQLLPTGREIAIWLAVPLTAAVGYAMAGPEQPYPGLAAYPLARALPIDYASAGLAGAVLGYATSVRLHLHRLLTPP